MLDGKILSAVLATLTAVAVSTTGGDISTQDIQTDPSEMDTDVGGLLSNPLEQLRDMATTAPEPDNQVYARLQADQLWQESIQVNNARIQMKNTTSLKIGSQTINSDEEVSVYGYSGSVMPGNSSVMLSGTAKGALTSGVNVSGVSGVDYRVETGEMVLEGVKESEIALSQVTGTIESGDSSTDFSSPRALAINSFSGDITLRPSNKTIILDGKVNRLEAGSFTFGE